MEPLSGSVDLGKGSHQTQFSWQERREEKRRTIGRGGQELGTNGRGGNPTKNPRRVIRERENYVLHTQYYKVQRVMRGYQGQ